MQETAPKSPDEESAALPVSSPSYMISAVGGLFLGILGLAIMLFFVSLPEDGQAFLAIIPVVGLLAAVLGTYVSAEPYDELRGLYDRLVHDAATVVKTQVDEGKSGLTGRLEGIRERLLAESMRLAKEAADLGADGIKIAEAAEMLRSEAEKCIK